MARFQIEDLLGKHKGVPAAICGHGPSLNKNKEELVSLQKTKELVLFSVNDWWKILDTPPDYWCISNPEYPMHIYSETFNKSGPFLLYATSCGQNISIPEMEKILECDYTLFDQRHFKNNDCPTIIKEITVDNLVYGNNPTIGAPPKGRENEIGFDPRAIYCKNKISPTIQEALQKAGKHISHYSTADTVAFHAIAFAILMGCNPIYLSGIDLDYRLGYAYDANFVNSYGLNVDQTSLTFLSDMSILNESAINLGIEIINLNKDSWHTKFKIGQMKGQ